MCLHKNEQIPGMFVMLMFLKGHDYCCVIMRHYFSVTRNGGTQCTFEFRDQTENIYFCFEQLAPLLSCLFPSPPDEIHPSSNFSQGVALFTKGTPHTQSTPILTLCLPASGVFLRIA